MKPQLNGRLIRLISLVFVIFCLCFLFRYLLKLEERNSLLREQEEENNRLLLLKEKEEEQERRRRLEIEREQKRIKKILENRAVVEPEITVENTVDLINQYYIGVPTPIESWTGKSKTKKKIEDCI